MLIEGREILSGERKWISRVVENQSDDKIKEEYSDWLRDKSEVRSQALQTLISSTQLSDFKEMMSSDISEEWLDLMGIKVTTHLIEENLSAYRERVFDLLAPAYEMIKKPCSDSDLAIGTSKIGGHPDVPPDFKWVNGNDCTAIYFDDTEGQEGNAGFFMQINLADIASAETCFPKKGLLSFFSFVESKDENPDCTGAFCAYFPETKNLVRKAPPPEVKEDNAVMSSQSIKFREVLNLPYHCNEYKRSLLDREWRDFSEIFPAYNTGTYFLGYGSPYVPYDQGYRFLFSSEVNSGFIFHIGIKEKHLQSLQFNEIGLDWIEFD